MRFLWGILWILWRFTLDGWWHWDILWDISWTVLYILWTVLWDDLWNMLWDTWWYIWFCICLWHNQGYSMEYVVGYFMDLYGIFGYFVWIVGCWPWKASLAYCLGIIGWYPAEHSNGWKLVKSCDWKKAMELVTKLRIAHCSDFFCGFYLGFSALWLGVLHG